MHPLPRTSSDGNSVVSRQISNTLNSILGASGLILVVGLMTWAGSEKRENPEDSPSLASRSMLRWPEGPVFSLAWSPDGRKLAGSGFGSFVRIWSPDSGGVKTIEGSSGQPRFVLGWTGDGERLVVGGMDVPVETWNVLNDPLDGSEPVARPLDPSAQARLIATCTQGRAIRLWAPSDCRQALLPPAGRSANTLAFAPDGGSIASGGLCETIRVWKTGSTREWRRFPCDARGINSVVFSPDSSTLVSGGGGPLRLWNVETGREVARLGEVTSGSATLAFSPDGRKLAEAKWDGSIRIWNLSTRLEETRFRGHAGQIIALAWSPDGHLLASGGYDSAVRVWQVEDAMVLSKAD